MIGFNNLGRLGQLGNQMFQFAVTKAVARNQGITFRVPNHKEVMTDILGNKLRIELFDCFDLECLNYGMMNPESCYVYHEKGYEFDADVLYIDRQKDWILNGFFQSEKYFQKIESEIRKDFTFKKEIIDECSDIIEDIYDDPIALHIRRGDFLINSGNHFNLSLDYYEKALKKFDASRQVVIFSDDPNWCMEQALFTDNRFIVSQAAGPYHDLYMMSQCSDFIIANSTFSWWGAWLANCGRVIAPKQWFGSNNAHLNIKDLYCEHWEICDG